ncbi:hypothetical protein AQUCO_02500281v1 [Aquilegia coerulea]|uniref:Uncharacterized protein n=1 Tax=Aquilegia coerulea TaxID=218851 RepID=A0A2G5DAB3_AQUCA|nr:hypothetical protein AQUCO_02500281v1 [Aquilegia coerulea]
MSSWNQLISQILLQAHPPQVPEFLGPAALKPKCLTISFGYNEIDSVRIKHKVLDSCPLEINGISLGSSQKRGVSEACDEENKNRLDIVSVLQSGKRHSFVF